MRHFLRFIPVGMRDQARKLYAGLDSAEAGNDGTKDAIPSSLQPPPVAQTKSTPPAAPANPAKAIAPEADGPEFGGLIERRGTDHRGLMPPPYAKTKKAEALKQRTHAEPVIDKALALARAKVENPADIESTGTFLSSLDNSAITLADSGLFQQTLTIDDDDDDDAAREAFNPYNHS